jgi:predicted metal-binding transcription factor (methanogenesis marker protein 9)
MVGIIKIQPMPFKRTMPFAGITAQDFVNLKESTAKKGKVFKTI